MSVVYFIVILIGIITVHEFGHFIFARIFGVDVLEFAIGFGPKLYERRGKKTSFRINVVPVGGYVKLAGEDPTEEQKEGIVGLYSKPAWQRLLIFFAGPLFFCACWLYALCNHSRLLGRALCLNCTC